MRRTRRRSLAHAIPLAALALVGPTALAAAVPAAAGFPTAGARLLSGTFANVAGRGLPGMTVTVTVVGGQHAVGSSYTPPLVGTARTRSDGTWTLRLPVVLPRAVAAAAAANGGILNVLATVSGIAPDGMHLLGAEYLPLDVTGAGGAPKLAALGSAVTSPAAAVYPDGHRASRVAVTVAGSEVTAASTVSAALRSAVSGAGEYQTATGAAEPAGYRPAVVEGVDYAAVVPEDNPCSPVPNKVLGTSIAYTTVGETHAYAHAKASFYYHASMSSYMAGVANFGDGPVVLSGGGFRNAHGGVGAGIAGKAAPWAYQYKVPVRFNQVRYGTYCVHGGYTYWTGIEPIGYSVPAGGATDAYGRNVISADGGANWSKAPVAHRAIVRAGDLETVDYSKSITYTGGATVFGIGIQVTTSYDTNHSQTYTADESSYRHDIWGGADGFGYNANGTLRDPKVIYSW